MIVLGVFLIVFLLGFIAFGKRPKNPNPYIRAHQSKWKTEKDYQEYLEWLDKQGGDLPINEMKFREDVEVMNEVSKNFK